MPIITSLVLSHPHITFHKVALSAAEKIETHPPAIAEKGHCILPLAYSRQAPVAAPERYQQEEPKRLPGRWGDLWHSATAWRRMNEDLCQKDPPAPENVAPPRPVAQTARRVRQHQEGGISRPFTVTLKSVAGLLMGVGLLTGLGGAQDLPRRRFALGVGQSEMSDPDLFDAPQRPLRHNAPSHGQEDNAMAIVKRHAPSLQRSGQGGAHPLYTDAELKYLESISIEKEANRVYVPLTNHNRRKYGAGKIYRTQRKNRGKHFHRVRYVEMNGKLIPVRVKRHPSEHLIYEIYDLHLPEKAGFPIKFNGVQWVFDKRPAEPKTTRQAPFGGESRRASYALSDPLPEHVFLRFG
ncbi:hypothetical protein BK025_10425 [Sodalis sp. TME1]|nr:hypothetical protein BK025_10425 [Sodalis sp. TME1]